MKYRKKMLIFQFRQSKLIQSLHYSYFNVSTGLSLAAFIVCALTDINVTKITITPGIAISQNESDIFVEKLLKH